MGSKSKELGVRHTNRERPLVGTYAVCTFALCPWSPEFVVRSSHLAFGSWQSVARGILKFSSTQAFCSRIVMSTDKFAHMCVAMVVCVWECACTPTNNWHLRQSLFWSRPNCKLKFPMLLLLPSATAATAAAVCSCSSSDSNVQWTVSYGRSKAEGTEYGACCTAYAIVPLLNSIASVYRLPFTWIFTRPAAFATRRGIAL